MEHAYAPLLKQSDYENLPSDDFESFLILEELARSRLYVGAEKDQNDQVFFPQMEEYMTKVSGIAAELQVPGIEYNHRTSSTYTEFDRFRAAVDFQVAQISIKVARNNRKNLIAFSGSDRKKIQHYLEKIKESLVASDLSDRRRDALLQRIADFESELAKPKIKLGTALAVIALLIATGRDFQEIAIDFAKSSDALIELVTGEQSAQDEGKFSGQSEPRRLQSPPERITDQSANKSDGWSGGNFSEDLDDDVPF